MHIRWTRRRLLSNRQTGEALCPHKDVAEPITLAPALVHNKRPLWYPGPTIRECCIEAEHGMSLAAWWWEALHRFADLRNGGLPDREITAALLEQEDYILSLLEEQIPRPTAKQAAEYEKHRATAGLKKRRLRPRLAGPLAVLGLAWPCTRGDLEARYRAILKTHHPDKGGNPDEFIRLKAIYERIRPLIY
jgi:hypothetical protein